MALAHMPAAGFSLLFEVLDWIDEKELCTFGRNGWAGTSPAQRYH